MAVKILVLMTTLGFTWVVRTIDKQNAADDKRELRISQNKIRLDIIDATRFSRDDGYQLKDDVLKAMKTEFDGMKRCMNKIQRGQQCD